MRRGGRLAVRSRFAHAILAIMAMLPCAAHAQLGSMRLYGELNFDLEFINGAQPDGSNPTVVRVSSNSSRFGIRGSEYLGAGLAAIYQVESSVQADTEGGSIATRETYAGLQNDWGTLKLGKFLTPYDDVHPIFGNAPTLSTSVLSTAALWSQGLQPKGQGGFDARLGNSIRYESPTINGASAELQYSTRDSSGNADGAAGDNGDHTSEIRHANVWSLGAFYTNGPLELGLAYELNDKIRVTGRRDTAFTISGGYDFGSSTSEFGPRIAGVYEHLRYDTPTGDLSREFFGISATVPVAGGLIYAFVGQASNGTGNAIDGTQIGELVKGPNTGSTQWELSYSYSLSLRTMLYAGYVKIQNRSNAPYTFNINDYAIAPGAKPSGFALGIAHFF
jgi:predicted porin